MEISVIAKGVERRNDVMPVSIVVLWILIYSFFIILFFALRRRVLNNHYYYDVIPRESRYRKSFFYISKYDKDPGKIRISLLEMVFVLVALIIWCQFFGLLYALLSMLRVYLAGDMQVCVYLGKDASLTAGLILGILYSNLFLFLPWPCMTALTLYLSKFQRAKFLAKEMLWCLLFTIIGVPIFLLGTDNYARANDTALYVNRYFSLQEEEYIFDEIQELVIEKSYNDDNEIRRIYCYIEDDKGNRTDTLSYLLEYDMVEFLFSKINLEKCEVIDRANLTKSEQEQLLRECSLEDEEIYRYFFDLDLP